MDELPFALTGSQSRAIEEIGADLARPNQMNRMLMGDVGSGKTIVAFWAMIRAVECGHQAAMMAPTELLAGAALQRIRARVRGARRKERAPDRERDGGGARQILRGLHRAAKSRRVRNACADSGAGAKCDRLALAVIDEQHRFGVFDRAKLKALGAAGESADDDGDADSAKPCDDAVRNLDVSSLDEMPAGRTPEHRDFHRERARASMPSCAANLTAAVAPTTSCRLSRAKKTKPSRYPPRRRG